MQGCARPGQVLQRGGMHIAGRGWVAARMALIAHLPSAPAYGPALRAALCSAGIMHRGGGELEHSGMGEAPRRARAPRGQLLLIEALPVELGRQGSFHLVMSQELAGSLSRHEL